MSAYLFHGSEGKAFGAKVAWKICQSQNLTAAWVWDSYGIGVGLLWWVYLASFFSGWFLVGSLGAFLLKGRSLWQFKLLMVVHGVGIRFYNWDLCAGLLWSIYLVVQGSLIHSQHYNWHVEGPSYVKVGHRIVYDYAVPFSAKLSSVITKSDSFWLAARSDVLVVVKIVRVCVYIYLYNLLWQDWGREREEVGMFVLPGNLMIGRWMKGWTLSVSWE